MEAFQIGFIRAIAAAAGAVIVGEPEIDEGVDIVVSHTSPNHSAVPERKVMLEVQLKSTHIGAVGDAVSTDMRADRYSYYATADPTIRKIVVILRMPLNPANWVTAEHESLRLSHCAYWVNLAGNPETTGATKRITAPATQVFDDVALCDIMERIGQGGTP